MGVMAVFTDEIPDVVIKNGLVTMGPIGNRSPLCMPVAEFRAFVRRGQAALAVYDAPPGNVEPIERRRGREH